MGPAIRSFFNDYFRRIGHMVTGTVRFAGGVSALGIQATRATFTPPFYPGLAVEQMFLLGVRSFLLVTVTALAVGGVMALQFGYGLEKFGGKLYVPKVLSLAILREMGPVFTSLLVAGRIGAGMAAEISSMVVTQQIDAIRALGTSPVRKIVVPRLLATVIVLPLLTIYADFIAMFGGMLVSVQEMGITPEFYFQKFLEPLKMQDLFTGLAKTLVFAVFIALCACWKGLNTQGGTKGVGDSTTWVVVTCSIFILIGDFFLTKLFIML